MIGCFAVLNVDVFCGISDVDIVCSLSWTAAM